MNCRDVRNQLDGYVDGELTATENEAVRSHLETCAACTAELAAVRAVKDRAAALPVEIEPGDDLWPGIERAIAGDSTGVKAHPRSRRLWPAAWTPGSPTWRAAATVAAAAITIALGVREWHARTGSDSRGGTWEVTTLAGAPMVGTKDVTTKTSLPHAEWLRTDAR